MPMPDDIRRMTSSAAGLMGVSTAVTLASGRVVDALPGLATINDTALGAPGQINGDERTLRFVAVDVPGLQAGDLLTWDGKAWKIKHPHIMGAGALIKAFLQEVP